jgi:hypothetical protein
MNIILIVGALLIGGAFVLSKKVASGPVGSEKANANGLVEAEPFRLAEARGCTLDQYALARMMVSEAGSKASRIAVGWAACNYAAARGESISTALLRGKGTSDGKFGAQNLGKYASTKAVPTDEAISDAKTILAQTIPDPTKGCRQWDAPAAQNAALKAKVAGYTKTADEVAASRSKTNDLVMVPGITNIRFWRPKGVKVA